MKTFKQYFSELAMKRGTTIDFFKDGKQELYATATLENGEIFSFYSNSVPYTEDQLRQVINKDIELSTNNSINVWGITFTDEEGNVDIQTKEKGVSLQVFAAMEIFMKKLFKSKHPEAINFSGVKAETSRIKLYDLLAKKIEKAGYKRFKIKTENYKFFLIKKTILRV